MFVFSESTAPPGDFGDVTLTPPPEFGDDVSPGLATMLHDAHVVLNESHRIALSTCDDANPNDLMYSDGRYR